MDSLSPTQLNTEILDAKSTVSDISIPSTSTAKPTESISEKPQKLKIQVVEPKSTTTTTPTKSKSPEAFRAQTTTNNILLNKDNKNNKQNINLYSKSYHPFEKTKENEYSMHREKIKPSNVSIFNIGFNYVKPKTYGFKYGDTESIFLLMGNRTDISNASQIILQTMPQTTPQTETQTETQTTPQTTPQQETQQETQQEKESDKPPEYTQSVETEEQILANRQIEEAAEIAAEEAASKIFETIYQGATNFDEIIQQELMKDEKEKNIRNAEIDRLDKQFEATHADMGSNKWQSYQNNINALLPTLLNVSKDKVKFELKTTPNAKQQYAIIHSIISEGKELPVGWKITMIGDYMTSKTGEESIFKGVKFGICQTEQAYSEGKIYEDTVPTSITSKSYNLLGGPYKIRIIQALLYDDPKRYLLSDADVESYNTLISKIKDLREAVFKSNEQDKGKGKAKA